MSYQPTAAEKGIARSNDPRDDYILLGIDAEGSHHVYRTYAEEVVVVEGTERVWCEDVAGVSVDEWMSHIADVRGWDYLGYGPLARVVATNAGLAADAA